MALSSHVLVPIPGICGLRPFRKKLRIGALHPAGALAPPALPPYFSSAHRHLCRQDGGSGEPRALPRAHPTSQLALFIALLPCWMESQAGGQGSPRIQQPPLGFSLGSSPKPQDFGCLSAHVNVPTLPLPQGLGLQKRRKCLWT